MKRLLWLLFFPLSLAFAELNQPPYAVDDEATYENFKIIFKEKLDVRPTSITMDTAAPTTPNSDTIYLENFLRVWVNFDGSTGAANFDFNVSSVTRSSAGVYVINFDRDFADTNYACVAGIDRSTVAGSAPRFAVFDNKLVGSVDLYVSNAADSANVDSNPIDVMCVGDN